jgi:hypothetical protein
MNEGGMLSMQFEVVIAAAMQAATITTNLNQFFGNLMLLGAGIVGGWGGVHILMGGFQIAGAHGNVQKVEHGIDAIKHAGWGVAIALLSGAAGMMLKGIVPFTPFS